MSLKHLTSRHVRIQVPRSYGLLVFGCILALVLLLLPGGHAAVREGFAGAGSDIDPQARIPTYYRDAKMFSEDLDADGAADLVLLSGEGVYQRYAENGSLLWSRDYYDITSQLGLVPGAPAQFLADFHGLRAHLHTEHGQVFTDLDGDGAKDLIASLSIYTKEPTQAMLTALVKIDLDDGALIDARMFPGVLRQIMVADLDGDAADELVLGVEDGPAYGTPPRGGDTTTRVWAEDLRTGDLRWEWDSGTSWARLFGIGTGGFDGDGTDVVFSVTEGFDAVYGIDTVGFHIQQEVVALDGKTGAPIWNRTVDDLVRSIAVDDLDGDTLDDVLVHIEEPANVADSRGPDRAFVAAYRGFDGAGLWSLKGLLGDVPKIHQMAILPGTTPVVAFSHTDESMVGLTVERNTYLRLVNAATGADVDAATVTQVLLPGQPVRVLIDADPRVPEAVSTAPPIDHLRLVTHDIDADGDLDVVVGSKRGLVAYHVLPSGLSMAWSDPHPTHRDNLIVVDGSGGAGVWSHGWYSDNGIDPDAGDYRLLDEYVKPHRLFGFDLTDGAPLADKPLFGMMNAVVRLDLDGEGPLDRVVAGPGGTVFALQGDGPEMLWTGDLGNMIVDLLPRDLDADGREDLFVQGRDTFMGIRHDGGILWQHDLLALNQDRRAYVEELAADDLNGDATPDFVYAIRSAYGAGLGTNPSRIGAVDGRTGEELWAFPATEPSSSFTSVVIADLDANGRNDVGYAVRHQAGPHYTIGALDGKHGILLWQLDEFAAGSTHVMNSDSLRAADVDGDGATELLVLSAAGTVRTHDGATGAARSQVPIQNVSILGLQGLFTGPIFGAEEWGYVVNWNTNRGMDGVLGFYAIDGTHVGDLHHRGSGLFASVRFADVDGDGTSEVLAGAFYGHLVIEPEALLNGTDPYLANLDGHEASAFGIADIDGDGDEEFEYHPYDGYAPAEYDLWAVGDRHIRGMAVGVVDLHKMEQDEPVDPEDPDNETPVNVPPRAGFTVDRSTASPGEPFTFTSTSKDADGEVVAVEWTFGDGSTATGTEVTRSFSQTGGISVHLKVTDDDGATDTATGSVTVSADRDFAIRQSRDGSQASPGEVVSYQVEVYNAGGSADTFSLLLQGPDIWTLAVEGDATVTVPAGAVHEWTVLVTVDRPSLREAVVATVASSESIQQRTHQVVVPLVVDASLDDEGATYGPLDPVRGTLRLTWRDGTPVEGVAVGVQERGATSAGEVVTDADGRAAFTVAHDEAYRSPGGYSVRLDPSVPGYSTYRVLPFQVTLTG